jgi:hypothetical protein
VLVVRLLRTATVGVVGLLAVGLLLRRALLLRVLLLGGIAPVVWLLLVAGMPKLAGIYRRAVIAWPTAGLRRRR